LVPPQTQLEEEKPINICLSAMQMYEELKTLAWRTGSIEQPRDGPNANFRCSVVAEIPAKVEGERPDWHPTEENGDA
jgi:hypothetical protein